MDTGWDFYSLMTYTPKYKAKHLYDLICSTWYEKIKTFFVKITRKKSLISFSSTLLDHTLCILCNTGQNQKKPYASITKEHKSNMTSKTFSTKQLIIGSMPQMPKYDVPNTKQKTSVLQKQYGEMNISMSSPRQISASLLHQWRNLMAATHFPYH
jgi:hypothetical protein